ncbi:TlpA family protein disulfide reductase [Carboxylicivirga sp. RSCT41]|uniref:TlpA family protein disulfide reductase n=1 Tax=Carboxylicivirga agarovorans TaxID=3417570 RepID=UPI003D336A39
MRIIIYVCLIAMLSACQTGQKGYIIEGALSGYETDSLYFYDELDWLSANTIKVPVVDGKFRFEGYCEAPVRLKVWGDKPSFNEAPPLLGTIFLGNYHYNIEVGFKKLKVETDNPDQIVHAKLIAIIDRDEAAKTIKEHLDSPAAVNFYYNNRARYDDNIKQVAESFTGRATKVPDYTRLMNMVYAKTGVKEGMDARDLTVYGIDGQPARLLSDDGKATLVYFYNPEGDDHYPYNHIKKAYEKYQGSNINFKGFCMHVRDQRWIMDADYCEIPFPVYGGTDDKINRIEEQYGVHVSPSVLLVNKEGKIITCLPWYKITGRLDEMIEKAL